MTRSILASLILVALCAAGCESKSHVVHESTVTQKFAAFGKNGWSVSGDGIQDKRTANQNNNLRYTGNSTNYFGGPNSTEWKTNFKVDDPRPELPAPPIATQPPANIDPVTGIPLRQ